MKLLKDAQKVSAILKNISPPTRLAILLAIGNGETCVCHLEAVLGKRQAYISQHLMALRQADILLDRRDGRFVYYRIADLSVLELIHDAGRLAGVEIDPPPATTMCECPQCAEEQPGYLSLDEVEA